MKFYLIVGVALSLCITFCTSSKRAYAQEPQRIQLPEYYKGEGIIFPESYSHSITLQHVKERMTPTKDQVKQAEQIFIEKYNSTMGNDPRVLGFKPVEDVKNKFREYNRQYLGYIDQNGDKVILIQLLNFENRRKAKKNFPNWQNEFITGFGDFYERNVTIFTVNISDKTLSYGTGV